MVQDPDGRHAQEPHARGLNGERLARHFGIRMTSTLSVRGFSRDPLVMTRLKGETDAGAPTPATNPEPAFSIMLQLRDLPHHELWVAGRLTHSGAVPVGAVSVVNLEDQPVSLLSGTFDALQFYVPHTLFEDLAGEDGFTRPTSLAWPRARPDPVAAALGALLLPAIETPEPAMSLFAEHVAVAFLGHAVQRYGQASAAANPLRAGLAPWQERRAKELMRARLATSLSMTDVSRECRLSPSYFAAAFRRSTGLSPHQYLSRLRVEEARSLMLGTTLPLDEIALRCGFGSQSYFTRMFTKLAGISPGQWRRLHGAAA